MPLRVLNTTTKSVPMAALILGGSILVSRILGVVRDHILAGRFGAGAELDIYFAAFRIPDFIYSILLGGAIASAFIPVFISYFSKDKKEAWRMAHSFFSVASVSLFGFVVILFFLMPYIMYAVVPGFDAASQHTAVLMSRIMLLSPFFLGLSAVFSGILHSMKRFFVYSLAPIFYNLGIIIGAVWFTQWWGIFGLAWGVVLGAFLHFLIQTPASFSSGFRILPFHFHVHKGTRRIFQLMLPRALGLAADQINLWIITAIASTLAAGSLAIFNFANNIQYLPIGVVGISFATAVFPKLSESISQNAYSTYLQEVSRALRSVLFLVLPLSVFMFVLRAHLVRIILGTGAFGWEDTRLTAAALGAFTLGIFAYALNPILSRAFYAKENTKTPVIAIAIGSLTTIFLSGFLIFVVFPYDGLLIRLGGIFKIHDLPNIAILGLPIAFSLGGIVAFLLLLIAFHRDNRANSTLIKEFTAAFGRIALASICAGFAAWFSLHLFGRISGPIDTFLLIFLQACFAGLIGSAIYFFIAHLMHFEELRVLTMFIQKKILHKKIAEEAYIEHLNGFHREE